MTMTLIADAAGRRRRRGLPDRPEQWNEQIAAAIAAANGIAS